MRKHNAGRRCRIIACRRRVPRPTVDRQRVRGEVRTPCQPSLTFAEQRRHGQYQHGNENPSPRSPTRPPTASAPRRNSRHGRRGPRITCEEVAAQPFPRSRLWRMPDPDRPAPGSIASGCGQCRHRARNAASPPSTGMDHPAESFRVRSERNCDPVIADREMAETPPPADAKGTAFRRPAPTSHAKPTNPTIIAGSAFIGAKASAPTPPGERRQPASPTGERPQAPRQTVEGIHEPVLALLRRSGRRLTGMFGARFFGTCSAGARHIAGRRSRN